MNSNTTTMSVIFISTTTMCRNRAGGQILKWRRADKVREAVKQKMLYLILFLWNIDTTTTTTTKPQNTSRGAT